MIRDASAKSYIKPALSDLRFAWTVAAWSPSFTEFLHEHLIELERSAVTEARSHPEVFMSQVIMAAIKSGLRVEGLHLPGARYLNIGVPENLIQALRTELDSL